MAASDAIIIQTDPKGNYSLGSVARANVDRVDILDIDLLLTTKDGTRYVLPGGGISGMQSSPPDVVFADGSVSTAKLLASVGATPNLTVESLMPSSIKDDDRKHEKAKDADLEKQVQKLQHKISDQEKELREKLHDLEEQKKVIDQQAQEIQQHKQEQKNQPQEEKRDVSTLTVDTEQSVEQMVEQVQKMEENLHKSDYDYVPPHQYEVSRIVSTPPPGVPPPISMTPIVTLFMGNVVGTTVDDTTYPGYTAYYGGGGATGSGATAQIGPRDALQFSAATIVGDDGDNIIYAEGPLVGNTNPAVSNSQYYSKEFVLSVAGYFTTLNDVVIRNVPTNVSIVGATNNGDGTWTLPADYVITHSTFTLLYNTNAYTPGGDNTFDIEFYITGTSMRDANFECLQTFRFQYMDVTNVSQVTDPTLVYDNNGYTQQIYVLPTSDQPNIILAGEGNDIIYGSRNNDTITIGDGDNQVYAGAGNNTVVGGDGDNLVTGGDGINVVTLGDGTNTITLGNGANQVTVGTGSNTLTAGDGNNAIISAGGGGTFNIGAGSNTITVNSASGSQNIYTIATNYLSAAMTETVTNTITGGDNLYNISMGDGTNTVMIGNGTDLYNTTITMGAGTNTVSTGDGRHTISLGAGLSSVLTGSGNDAITAAGGGGTIDAGAGDNTITISSTTGSTDSYTLRTTGSGATTITAGDNNYTITVGSGANLIQIGDGSSSISATGSGNNNITAGSGDMTIEAGDGVNTIVTGSGIISIDAGNGAGNQITVDSSGSTAANTVTIAVGNGVGNQISVYGTTEGAASANKIAVGTGGGNTVDVADGNYTIAVGGVNGMVDTVTQLLTAGGDVITTGDGDSVIYIGSHSLGTTDTVYLGSGDNMVYVGTGTNSIVGGSGSNAVNFSYLTTPLTILFGTTGTSTASGTNVSDSFTGISSIYGTNYGDTITLNTGTLWVYGGSGNDAITLGSGVNYVYAGNGDNTITGSGSTTATGNMLYGGTGNNTFLSPNAGTAYNGTNGAALASIADNTVHTTTNTSSVDPFAYATGIPDTVSYSYDGSVATITLRLQTQVNKVSYVGSSDGVTINLSTGIGSGGAAAGSTYAFTPTSGYSSINAIAAGSSTTYLYPSFSDTVFYGCTGTSTTYVYDSGTTISSQHVIIVGGGGNVYVYGGAAQETFVFNPSRWNEVHYNSWGGATTPAGAVVNLDCVQHTFDATSYGYVSDITVNAYSGSNWGINKADSSLSWSTGDYFVPVSGVGFGSLYIVGTGKGDIIYGAAGSGLTEYYCTGGDNYFIGSSNVSDGTMFMFVQDGSYGTNVVIGAVATSGSAYNLLYTSTTRNTVNVVLSTALEAEAYANGWISASQHAEYNSFSMTYGGTTFDGFAYGFGGDRDPGTATSNVTYLKDFHNVLTYPGQSTTIIGDNSDSQICCRGSSLIITGTGANIISFVAGSQTIYSTGTHNTLNFEWSNNAYSGRIASYNSGYYPGGGVYVFLNNETDTTFLNTGTGGDQAAFFGGTGWDSFQVRLGDTGSYSYSTVQSNIVSLINGSTYSSGTSEPLQSTGSAWFYYDHVYSGAATIRGHGGNCVYFDNMGTSSQAFYGGTGSDIYYLTPDQVSHVTIYDTQNSSTLGVLRVPGWGGSTASGNAFGATDPFSTTVITGIDVIDVRSGLDTVTIGENTITLGANSVDDGIVATYNLSASDIQHVVGTSSTPTLYLKLDNGDIFRPTGTVDVVDGGGGTIYFYSSTTHNSSTLIATETHNASSYYIDQITYNNANNAHLNIHYGTG